MPRKEEVRQAVFENEKKLVEVGYLNVGENSWRREFLYPEEFTQIIQLTANTEYILDPTCFGYSLKPVQITDQKRQQLEKSALRAQEIVKKFEKALKGIYFISAIRGEVRSMSEILESEPSLGTHGEGLIEILSLLFRRPEFEKKAGKIVEWASKFGMTELKAGWWGRKYLSSDYIDPEFQTLTPHHFREHIQAKCRIQIPHTLWDLSNHAARTHLKMVDLAVFAE